MVLIALLLLVGALQVAAVDFDRLQNSLSLRFGPAALVSFRAWAKLLQESAGQAAQPDSSGSMTFSTAASGLEKTRTSGGTGSIGPPPKGLESVAHKMGMQVYAQNVIDRAELIALEGAGFDGASGPAVEEPA